MKAKLGKIVIDFFSGHFAYVGFVDLFNFFVVECLFCLDTLVADDFVDYEAGVAAF